MALINKMVKMVKMQGSMLLHKEHKLRRDQRTCRSSVNMQIGASKTIESLWACSLQHMHRDTNKFPCITRLLEVGKQMLERAAYNAFKSHENLAGYRKGFKVK